MITKFKKFQEDKDLEDFEEDVIADCPKEDNSEKEIKEEKMCILSDPGKNSFSVKFYNGLVGNSFI